MSYSPLSFTSKLFQLTALTCALALAGCGGGGGGDTIAPEPDLGVTQPGSGDNGGGEQTVEELNIVNSRLVDEDGNSINTVSLNGAYYEVEVTDENNQPVPNAKVSFAIDAEGIELSQTTSGSMLTDNEGKARIFLKPTSPDVSGAYSISATVSDNDNNTATSNLTFSVQTTRVMISPLIFKETNLISGGQTMVSLKVSDPTGNLLSGVMVNLNADCGQLPDQITSDSDGAIEFVYNSIDQDNILCSGMVRISASTGNSNQSANIMIRAPQANSIVYTSNELTLGIQNSGSSRTGTVEFTVYSNNVPVPNANVILSLEKSPLRLSFGSLDNRSDIRATTDRNGKVSVDIYPGTTPGPVEIKATLASDPRINGLSKGISIASSRVTQDGLSISFGSNALDWSLDGDETKIVARMVDRNGNSVPNGTVINFTTEGGKVSPASCATNDGVCEVTFSTQNPRPGDGRTSVLAVAEGEKSYIDLNQNNAWDECKVIGERDGKKIYETPSPTTCDVLVHNIGDTFRDDNENNTYEIGEFTYPSVTQAEQDCENNIRQFIQLKFPTASEIQKQRFEQDYVSKYVSPNKDETCNSGLDTVVRYQSIQLLTLGQREAEFTLVNASGNLLSPETIKSTDTTVRVRINSGGFLGLNPMPSGTTISGTMIVKTQSTNQPMVQVSTGNSSNSYKIRISNLTPNKSYSFIVKDKGENDTTVDRDYTFMSNPEGIIQEDIMLDSRPKVADVSDIALTKTGGQCQVTLESPAQVPDIVSTGLPGVNTGTISRFSIENCQAGDKFKVSATSPSNNTSSDIYTIQ
ncbi:hypothetical protein H4W00_000969 [Psychrobacter sp. PL19]|uniref:Ig-like domain-containing protein n=1 Tax=Psychrobacter sp. PL19 TaxID=2760711 RepID=UPI001AE924AB